MERQMDIIDRELKEENEMRRRMALRGDVARRDYTNQPARFGKRPIGEAMIREVEFTSQARAEYLRPLPGEGIISITGSGYPRARLRRGWTRVLRLVFDDIERPFFNAVHFDLEHAGKIIAWLEKVEGRVEKVFVHCHAGKSRSGAVAKFIAEKYDLSGGVRVYEYHNRRVYRILSQNIPHGIRAARVLSKGA